MSCGGNNDFKTHLEEKIWFFQTLSRYQLKIADSDPPHLGKPAPIDNNSISKLERISFLNTIMIEMASTLVLLFGKRLGMLYKVWKETKDVWESEEPERSRVEKMDRKERKALVKLFKDKEMIAAQEKTKFYELKAEWDAEKGGFDEIVMECLRRVAKLHQ
ncbi:unnamed protein product [Orchesella dallaii]|uniref:Uncharacterized protein n=1 Tax=Orchesella dallaii TaxID=48710 RepID=A0ABP1S3V0_9HEXA